MFIARARSRRTILEDKLVFKHKHPGKKIVGRTLLWASALSPTTPKLHLPSMSISMSVRAYIAPSPIIMLHKLGGRLLW